MNGPRSVLRISKSTKGAAHTVNERAALRFARFKKKEARRRMPASASLPV
jgi:hypothetical protein